MGIDWSKAPEGATHINQFAGRWIKHSGNGQYQFWNGAEWEMGFGCMDNRYTKRPEPDAWTGEGLPPVGSSVEFYSDDFDNEDYWSKYLTNGSKVEIIAHIASNAGLKEADLAVFAFQHPNGDRQVEQAISCCFRPIKTKEQIAAEEREKTCEEMLEIVKSRRPDPDIYDAIGALYDAGYRRMINAKA